LFGIGRPLVHLQHVFDPGDIVVIEIGHYPHFFPPRFQIVAQREKPDGFPSNAGNQFAFDGFFSDRTYRPTRAAFQRATAYDCNQTLFLAIVQHFRRSGPLFLLQGPIQTALLITVTDISEYLVGSVE
jgi:hypothetical protein